MGAAAGDTDRSRLVTPSPDHTGTRIYRWPDAEGEAVITSTRGHGSERRSVKPVTQTSG